MQPHADPAAEDLATANCEAEQHGGAYSKLVMPQTRTGGAVLSASARLPACSRHVSRPCGRGGPGGRVSSSQQGASTATSSAALQAIACIHALRMRPPVIYALWSAYPTLKAAESVQYRKLLHEWAPAAADRKIAGRGRRKLFVFCA